MNFPARRERGGFTLLELMAALVLVLVLGVLLITATRSITQRTDKIATVANWRQIAASIFAYQVDNAGKMPGPLLSLQYATYEVKPGQAPGALGYFVAPYLQPGLEGNGRAAGRTYTLKAFQSPALRKVSPLKDNAMQFHMNITIYTQGAEKITPFGYRSTGEPVMNWNAIVATFERYQCSMAEIPMFQMYDRDARGWSTATFEPLGVPPEPLFGNSRLALYFDGHVADYYPGVKNYPTTAASGLSLSGDRR